MTLQRPLPEIDQDAVGEISRERIERLRTALARLLHEDNAEAYGLCDQPADEDGTATERTIALHELARRLFPDGSA